MNEHTLKIGIVFFIGVVATAAVIYLTPLKWITVVEPTINDVSSEAFYAEYAGNEDEYVFIDVRPESAYDRVHAAGSDSVPLHTLYDERHTLPKSDKKIVLICSGGRASGVGYSYLEHYGFTNVTRIEGGIEAWQLAGLPVESNLE